MSSGVQDRARPPLMSRAELIAVTGTGHAYEEGSRQVAESPLKVAEQLERNEKILDRIEIRVTPGP